MYASNRITQPFFVRRNFKVQGTPPPVGWLPTDKSGLQFWFKADAGVTEAGGIVSAWADQSGLGRHASQSSAGARPSYNTNQQNGKPGISFGANRWLDFGTTNIAVEGSPNSLVVVSNASNPGGTWYQTWCTVNSDQVAGQYAALLSNDTNYADISWLFMIGSARIMRKAAGSFIGTPTSVAINYNGGAVATNGSWAGYRNNSLLSHAAGGTSQTGKNTNKLGSWWDGSLNFTGNIFEIFFYNSELTAGELTNVQSYVSSASRWAI